MLTRIAISSCLTAMLLACASRPQPTPARTPKASAPQTTPADQVQMRTPDQISAQPDLDMKPLQPVPVPLDSAVAGSPPSAR